MAEATLSVENLCKAFETLCQDFFNPKNKTKVLHDMCYTKTVECAAN